MKRAYKPLDPKDRLTRAREEAHFEMPDTKLRSAVIAQLNRPEKNPSPDVKQWMKDRYLP